MSFFSFRYDTELELEAWQTDGLPAPLSVSVTATATQRLATVEPAQAGASYEYAYAPDPLPPTSLQQDGNGNIYFPAEPGQQYYLGSSPPSGNTGAPAPQTAWAPVPTALDGAGKMHVVVPGKLTGTIYVRAVGGTATRSARVPALAPATPLDPPTGYAFTPTSATAAGVSWNNRTDNAGYRLQYATDAGFSQGLQTLELAKDTTSTTITTLSGDTTYYSHILTKGDGVNTTDSAYAATVTAKTPAPTGGIDPDAQKLIAAGAITDNVQISVLDAMFKAFKAKNLYTAILTGYPCIGGTEQAHKFNMVNPLDTDAAYRVTFPNGMTHSAAGMKGNGSNQYGETYIKGTAVNQNEYSLVANTSTEKAETSAAIGAVFQSTGNFYIADLIIKDPANGAALRFENDPFTSLSVTPADPSALGVTIGTRSVSNGHNGLYRRGVNVGGGTDSVSLPAFGTETFKLLSRNGGSLYDSRTYAGLFILNRGLSDQEAKDFSDIIYAADVALGRNAY